MTHILSSLDNDHLYGFLIEARRLSDWAEALGDELDGWQVHNTAVKIGKEHGLTEECILKAMGYEEEEE